MAKIEDKYIAELKAAALAKKAQEAAEKAAAEAAAIEAAKPKIVVENISGLEFSRRRNRRF